jgi:sporulation protein YlmC with PRC-barrel domain
MIRNLLATTAIASLLATGAYAQTATTTTTAPAATEQTQVKHADGHLASELIGKTVYNGAGDDAENIGSVTDLVISSDGDVEALVVGVGGFLGLGRKDVALEYDVAEWAERDGNEWLIIPTNKEALEALPDFDRSAFTPQAASAEVGNTTPATGQDIGVAAGTGAAATAPAATTDTTATAPAATTDSTAPAATTTDSTAVAPATTMVDRTTLTEVDEAAMSAEDIIGTTVYGANDENVGEISDVILADSKVDAVIIDVGGFLGIGEKSVAVGMENLAFMADADGDNYLYTQFTKEQLEAQPEYDEGTFATNRDGQLLVVPAN